MKDICQSAIPDWGNSHSGMKTYTDIPFQVIFNLQKSSRCCCISLLWASPIEGGQDSKWYAAKNRIVVREYGFPVHFCWYVFAVEIIIEVND